ncbi:MAG: LysM peptidoglycan-binding domain-containing protein [Oscillospiraceae bacterium]|nr:LysM peptidoglycan-binding domain-containing protein [Oscillospiraceae bacterium]
MICVIIVANIIQSNKRDEFSEGKFWPESSPEQSLEVKTYTVQPGDSFWKIAAEQLGNGNRYKELEEFNGLTPESIIFPG